MAPQQLVLWRKRVLVPFWIVRILLMIFVIAGCAYTLRHLDSVEEAIQPTTAYVAGAP
jgi:hypothetical protein